MSAVPVVERFLQAFNAADIDTMRELLEPDLVSYITDASGEEHELAGADAYLTAIDSMNLPTAEFSVVTTQAPVIVGDQVLVMVEVHASRGDRSLHNYAAHLMRVHEGRIAEMRMVEAKPAESEQFWSAPGS